MARLEKENQERLEPKRVQFAIDQLRQMDFEVTLIDGKEINFRFENELVKFFPYSGWHTGKSIKDGRGWNNLKKQLQKK